MAIKLLYVSTLAVLVLGATIGCRFANAQKIEGRSLTKNFKIEASKPSVFLQFEKFGEESSRASSAAPKFAFLRLTNNTILPIAVDANFDARVVKSEPLTLSDGISVQAIPNMSVVEVCFDVDVIPTTGSIKTNGGIVQGIQSKSKNPAENDKTTCFWRNAWRADDFGNGERVWIRPEHSIVFGVPVDYLKDNLKVSALFSYEWEFENKKLNFEEPKHKVFFYGSDLPK